MSRAGTVLTTLGVMVLMVCVAPFTKSRERSSQASESNGQLYAFYAFVGVNVAVFAIGIAVAGVVTFFD